MSGTTRSTLTKSYPITTKYPSTSHINTQTTTKNKRATFDETTTKPEPPKVNTTGNYCELSSDFSNIY